MPFMADRPHHLPHGAGRSPSSGKCPDRLRICNPATGWQSFPKTASNICFFILQLPKPAWSPSHLITGSRPPNGVTFSTMPGQKSYSPRAIIFKIWKSIRNDLQTIEQFIAVDGSTIPGWQYYQKFITDQPDTPPADVSLIRKTTSFNCTPAAPPAIPKELSSRTGL